MSPSTYLEICSERTWLNVPGNVVKITYVFFVFRARLEMGDYIFDDRFQTEEERTNAASLLAKVVGPSYQENLDCSKARNNTKPPRIHVIKK